MHAGSLSLDMPSHVLNLPGRPQAVTTVRVLDRHRHGRLTSIPPISLDSFPQWLTLVTPSQVDISPSVERRCIRSYVEILTAFVRWSLEIPKGHCTNVDGLTRRVPHTFALKYIAIALIVTHLRDYFDISFNF